MTASILRGPGLNAKGVWSQNPDLDDYGQDSVTYTALTTLTGNYNSPCANDDHKADIEALCREVRRISDARLVEGKSLVDPLCPRKTPFMTLNSTERLMAEENMAAASQWMALGAVATTRNRMEFTRSESENPNNGNAFQHAFWNYLLAEAGGIDWAKRWGDAHEYATLNNLQADSIVETTMDLFNNAYGRQMYRTLWETDVRDIFVDPVVYLKEKIAAGELLRVVTPAEGPKCLAPTDATGQIAMWPWGPYGN